MMLQKFRILSLTLWCFFWKACLPHLLLHSSSRKVPSPLCLQSERGNRTPQGQKKTNPPKKWKQTIPSVHFNCPGVYSLHDGRIALQCVHFFFNSWIVMPTRTLNKWDLFFLNIIDGSSAVETGTAPPELSGPNYTYSGAGLGTKISF